VLPWTPSFSFYRAYCDRARLSLPNVAHEQARSIACCPTSLAKLGRSHVKKFHTNIYFIQHCGESSPHQPWYQGLTGWFDITKEPDAYREYSCLVRSVSLRFVFLNVYAIFVLSSNGSDDISRPLLLRITTMIIPRVFWHQFCCQNFVFERHTKVAINSLPLSPLDNCHVSKLKQ
jgi:hypothetical protein